MGGGSTAQIGTAAGRQPLDYVAIYTQRGEMVGYHNSRGWRPHGWVVQVKAELRSGSILSENRQTSCAPLAFASGFDGTELERKER